MRFQLRRRPGISALAKPGAIAAYGPSFTNFRASVNIESYGNPDGDGGLIFRLNERGYCLLLVQEGSHAIAYKPVKKFWDQRSRGVRRQPYLHSDRRNCGHQPH
jgi:hypothetical protein